MNILFLCSRVPYPPIKGDKLRAYYQLTELSKKHNITLIAFSEREDNNDSLRVLSNSCAQVVIINHGRATRVSNSVGQILGSLPLQCAYYRSDMMQNAISRALFEGEYDIVQVQLARMMHYIAQTEAEIKNIPVLLDFVDTLSLNMRRRLERERPMFKPFFFYEWYKMKKYERKLDDHFDGAIVSSPVDQKALPYSDRVEVVPNGVDIDYFHFFSPSQRKPKTVIFTGNMGYFPNVDAVTYFCRQIYPRIKRKLPGVQFRVVGYSPKAVVSRLSAFDGSIEVTGFVDNIANELGAATVAVAPMLSGSGMQFKILEAMATGTPVVATKLATRAIDVDPDRNIIIADRPDEFAEGILRLIRNTTLRNAVGTRGRELVERKYSWPRIVKGLENMYEKTVELHRRKNVVLFGAKHR